MILRLDGTTLVTRGAFVFDDPQTPEEQATKASYAKVLGSAETVNQSLEKAGRVADFLELGELMGRDALARDCGGALPDDADSLDLPAAQVVAHGLGKGVLAEVDAER